MPLEKEIAEHYACDQYTIDTTFNTTEYDYKTGPLKTPDCFGFTAPSGILSVPQEDGISVDERLDHLEYNFAETCANTDAVQAWTYPIEEVRKQAHTHDPHHLHSKSIEISGQSYDKVQFPKDVAEALYGFAMNESGLEAHLDDMVCRSRGTGVQAWVDSLVRNKHKRCFAYKCKLFLCAKRGGGSRCEQAQSILKGRGTLKSSMRKWRLFELVKKHKQDVETYEGRGFLIKSRSTFLTGRASFPIIL